MINIDNKINPSWEHTSWKWALECLKSELHNENSKVLFCGAIEELFISKTLNKEYVNQVLDHCDSWIGVSHQHAKFLNRYFSKNDVKQNPLHKYIHKCKAFITLSDYMSNYWKSTFPSAKIIKVFHPFPLREKVFNFDRFIAQPKIRSLGLWGRKFNIWDHLDYPKDGGSHDSFLPFEKFDKTFVDTIQFMDVRDASANNGILECIRRNTPILTSQHPALKEYLGAKYPFYFKNLPEANKKIKDNKLIKETHEYLLNMNKEFINIENFTNTIKKIIS